MINPNDTKIRKDGDFPAGGTTQRFTLLRWLDAHAAEVQRAYSYGNPTARRILRNAARLRLVQHE